MNKKRYQEEYEEGSNLLWPSEEEDKITRKFYRDLSHLSKKEIHNKNKNSNFLQQIFRVLTGKAGSSKNLDKSIKKF
ncbi:hypothetical protein [uncultured Prochlorococcus sp.]|uniref:hypothetical protein n=1 Tax=uncultured Prochlorococcus sp. TaxID=159733 RepID=UPI0032B14986